MAIYNPTYQPYNPYAQQYYQQPIQAQQIQTQPQIQNGGFISVRSEIEARNYPVAPGNSVTFKDENVPYVYTKTMGFSQLDSPVFERYRLVKEDAPEVPAQSSAPAKAPYALKTEVEAGYGALLKEIEAIKAEIGGLAAKRSKAKKEDKEAGEA